MGILASLFGGALGLGDLPAPDPSHAPAANDAASIAALDAEVGKVAKGYFTVEQSRHFVLDAPLGWQPVVKRIANLVKEKGGERVPIASVDPGLQLVEVFRIKGEHGLAVAMNYTQSPQAPRTVGYYAVRLPAAH